VGAAEPFDDLFHLGPRDGEGHLVILVCPKMRSPEQGRMTWGSPVCMVVTMMSRRRPRPSNEEWRRPPRFQSEAWVSRMTWAGLA